MAAIGDSRATFEQFVKAKPRPFYPVEIQGPDHTPLSLARCAERIKAIIERESKRVVPSSLKLTCPITKEPLCDPVVTKCGHIFSKTALERARQIRNECPLGCGPIESVGPVYLQPLIEDAAPIITLDRCKKENEPLARQYFEIAADLMRKQCYEVALGAYEQVFLHSKDLQRYRRIPELYEKLSEPEKAKLASLYLSFYRIKKAAELPSWDRGKAKESDYTESFPLKSKEGILLQTALMLLRWQSQRLLDVTMEAAAFQNPEDAAALYQQMVAYAPHRLDAYAKLAPLLKDPEDREALARQEAFYRSQPLPVCPPVSVELLTHETFKAIFPPYPEELKAFLSSDCCFCPGKKRSETHDIIPLFPQISVKQGIRPRDVYNLEQLMKYKDLGDLYGTAKVKEEATDTFYWAVMPKECLPDHRWSSFPPNEVPEGYEWPTVLEGITAFVWQGLFRDQLPYRHIWCREKAENGSHCVLRTCPTDRNIKIETSFGAELAPIRKFPVRP